MLVVLTACYGTSDDGVAVSGLYGSWERIRSEGGYSGDTIFAAEAGARLEITRDHKIREYRGDKLEVATTFSVQKGLTFDRGDSIFTTLVFADAILSSNELAIIRLSGDTLVLSGTGSEAWTHYLIRRGREEQMRRR